MSLESALQSPINRRDLLFARRGRNRNDGNQPPRRSTTTAGSSNLPPEGPSFWDKILNRRTFLGGVGTLAAGGTALYVAEQTGLINLVPDQERQPLPDTLEGLVQEVKIMEESFRDKSLFNNIKRERYTQLLAGVYSIYYAGYPSQEQILETISWTDSLDEFIDQDVLLTNRPTLSPQELAHERELSRSTTAKAHNPKKRITINAGGDLFKQELLSRAKNLPKDWNPLKMLRLSLLHEFSHLVNETSDPVLMSALDPRRRLIKDVRAEGFRVIGIDGEGMYNQIFSDFHEATIELISKELNQKQFGFFVSSYQSETNRDVPGMVTNLERILEATGVTVVELRNFHRNSQLKEFVLLLMDRSGAFASAPEQVKLKVGLDLVVAIEDNNQRLIQGYITQATSFRQNQPR